MPDLYRIREWRGMWQVVDNRTDDQLAGNLSHQEACVAVGKLVNDLCKKCRRFFMDMGCACSARSYGECDCPRCQGLCTCKGRV